MTEVIKFFYALSDANTKELLESNAGGAKLGFVCGKDQIIKALEDELLKMGVGEKKQIKILAADGLGERDESLMQLLPKEQFAGIDLKIGMALIGQDESGQSVHATVVKIDDENVLLDYNHPYASKDLIFDVEITERRQADSDEELTGVVKTPHVCACGGGGHSHEHSHGHSHGDGGCCGGHSHEHSHEHSHGDGGCCGGGHCKEH